MILQKAPEANYCLYGFRVRHFVWHICRWFGLTLVGDIMVGIVRKAKKKANIKTKLPVAESRSRR